MRGIDISRYDGFPLLPDTQKAYDESDFVIIKATEGLSYKHTDYFFDAVEMAIEDGKLIGAYHYASGKNPEAEADYFLATVKPYIGKIVLALDWEDSGNKAWNKDETWCSRFVHRIKDMSGLTCFLYTGMDGLDDCRNIANKVPLWFAGYPQDKNSWQVPKWPSYYSTAPWKAYTIWQFTSGGNTVDRDITNLTVAKWNEYCRPSLFSLGYDGEFPTLPTRGYYALGDGYYQLPESKEEVKKVQRLVNWINDGEIKVDGMYGNNTAAAVKLAQTNLRTYPDGLFGKKTLEAAKKYRK